MATRDEIRAKILASKPQAKRVIMFFGAEIEIRQPKLRDIMQAQNEPDREQGVINTLINYAFLPGTDIKVFDDADSDGLKEQPFGADFIRVANALTELTEVNFLDGAPNSGGTPESK